MINYNTAVGKCRSEVVGEEIETETLFLVPEEDPQTEEMAWIINYCKSHNRSD